MGAWDVQYSIIVSFADHDMGSGWFEFAQLQKQEKKRVNGMDERNILSAS